VLVRREADPESTPGWSAQDTEGGDAIEIGYYVFTTHRSFLNLQTAVRTIRTTRRA